MELFLLLILTLTAFLLYSRFGSVKQLLEQQRSDMGQLRAELLRLRDEIRGTAGETGPALITPARPTPPVAAPLAGPVAEPVPPVVIPQPVPAPEPVSQPVTESAPQPAPGRLAVPPAVRQPAPPRPSFIRRFLTDNPDLEKFIGENLINKIGIAILVLGIGYFVKYAIDQQWLSEAGRVAIGITAGAVLLGMAHRLRKTFTAFSSVLVGGGLTVLYFTIAIAFHYYSLFSQTSAFVIMVVITGFGVLLTLAYNRVELAIMTLLGGFATPFMVSSGEGNYIVLFTYILILDVGMLVLSYFRKWPQVHLLSYVCTVLLYGFWLSVSVVDQPNAPYTGAWVFASLFYGLFLTMNLLHNLKEKALFSRVDIGLLLSNTALYYSAGMITMAHIDGGRWQGAFTAGLAVVNLALARFLFRRAGVDRTLLYLLIGLVVTFGSLAIPVQLEGNYITMFWALEAVLLLWLSQKSSLRLMATSAVLVTGLMLISLWMDWESMYGDGAVQLLPVILNKAVITSLVAIGGLVGSRQLLGRQEAPIPFWPANLVISRYRQFLSYVLLITIYLAGALETNYQAINQYGFGPNRLAVLGAYNMLFAGVMLALAYRSGIQSWLRQAAGLGLLFLLLYVFVFATAPLGVLSDHYYGTSPSLAGFGWHYLSLASLAGILILLQRIIARLDPLPAAVARYWPWVLGFVVVYAATWELFNHVVFSRFPGVAIAQTSGQKALSYDQFDAVLQQVTTVGLPILWGICAFVFMWLGLSRKNRSFRVLSLALFALTLLKLFLYDMRDISEGGRVAAFIILGVLLLVISFMYQRIKKLLSADQPDSPVL
ncbi:DUF2339 domain-containing protein [Spirosoma sordidisoli]|uniref:DUF2339 domain-containing protein n=1 Tax=Spirosoma sordidisoli TaxID=2502893 RepID=A0A4Q2UKN5_9BACT|nr:DUF2339 domain-containing protein [Spirosoma sordidisoli]RYC68065.1 DUF2339 domain-containing protein [Spirosoma sordidisoli]